MKENKVTELQDDLKFVITEMRSVIAEVKDDKKKLAHSDASVRIKAASTITRAVGVQTYLLKR